MKLYDNDAYRDEFMELVYSLLHSDGTNDRANQIIDAFDSAMAVEAEPILPNDPLTLEELREMGGEPVWVECLGTKDYSAWTIVDICLNGIHTKYFYADFDYYGVEWLAYRRKLEGEI